jgi:peptidoglycan hydrolase CwlO-like protein
MKRRFGLTILVVLFSLLCFVGLGSYYERPVLAESSCPYPDQYSEECLGYLEEQLEKIQRQQSNVEKKLKDEEYQQLSLQEKIAYTNRQISQAENSIQSLEVQIASHNVEIKLLEKSIQEKEDNMSVLGQEINILEDTVVRRVTESYKSSFIGVLELFLDIKNFSDILRKTKYLEVTRTRDKESLGVYNQKVSEIREEENALAEKKSSLQIKRNSIEEEKIALAESREELKTQKAERERLLAQSKAAEAQLNAELKNLREKSNQVTAEISAMIMKLFRTGQIPANTPVSAGDILGFQGHTGFSYGSHLHFNLSGAGGGPLELDYFRITNGRVYSEKASSPLGDGAWLTQGYHFGYSLDMVGTYGWNNETYYVAPNEVCCTGSFAYLGCVPSGHYNLNGEGTPVRAIKAGLVTAVLTDPCGGRYVVVDHGDGEASLYLHLR